MARKKQEACLIRHPKGHCLDDNILNTVIVFIGWIIVTVSGAIVLAAVIAFVPLNVWTILTAFAVMFFGFLLTQVGIKD